MSSEPPDNNGDNNQEPTNNGSSGIFKTIDGKLIEIRDVWASNLEEEMQNIREVVLKYPFVAMDTEFPGVVARPVGDYGASDMQYQTLRCNVDMLKLIQLGLSFSDKYGNWAEGCVCWQFNFKFSLSGDIFAQDSIELLQASGIDFDKFERDGIDIQLFGEVIMMSGLVLTDEVKWISFHSMYDFAYLLKMLTCTNLPQEESLYLESLQMYFPCIYDVKYMMTAVEGLYGGLSALAETLQVGRIGPMHQAGSDSLLTAQTFFSLVTKYMSGILDDGRFRGELFGMGNNHTKYKSKGYTNGNNTMSTHTVTSTQHMSYSERGVSGSHYMSNHHSMSRVGSFGYAEEGY